MITYRTSRGYESKFGRRIRSTNNDNNEKKDGTNNGTTEYGRDTNWEVKSYLEYQGLKFLTRFDPITYVKLTEQGGPCCSSDLVKWIIDNSDHWNCSVSGWSCRPYSGAYKTPLHDTMMQPRTQTPSYKSTAA